MFREFQVAKLAQMLYSCGWDSRFSTRSAEIFATLLMREVHRQQFQLGEVPVEKIWINPKEVRKLFNGVRSTRRAKRRPERVEAYLERCRSLVERAANTVDALRSKGVDGITYQSIQSFILHAQRQIDQVERRLLRDETIPHEEKVFSIFEEHTRWVSKGKAGTPVELGVPVALIEDQYPVHPSPPDPVAGRGCGRSGADGGGSTGTVSGAASVQLRPGLSQPRQSVAARRVA